jgi:hypothetical protein
MAVVDFTGADLNNAAALMRALTDELILNHHFDSNWNNVNANATRDAADVLRWLSRPVGETFYQDGAAMLIGVNAETFAGGIPTHLGLAISNVTFATMDPGSGDYWDDSTFGTNSSEYFAPPNNTSHATTNSHCGVSELSGSNFTSARLITSPTSTSTSPTSPLSFYVVVEPTPGVYRQFGFGEMCKFRTDWEGGYFTTASAQSSINFRSSVNRLFGSGSTDNSDSNHHDAGLIVWAPGWTGILQTDSTNGRGWMRGIVNDVQSDPVGFGIQTCWPCMGWSARDMLSYHHLAPSTITLQSPRERQIIFGYNRRDYDNAAAEFHPMGFLPDIWPAVIQDVDAGSVIEPISGRKFMVVPYRTKQIDDDIANGTGKFGILIENPALVVT